MKGYCVSEIEIYNEAETVDLSESILNDVNLQNPAHVVGNLILDISRITMDLASIERVPRYTCSRRENDAEHSLMLGLITAELCDRYFTELDAGLATQLALVHEFTELVTDDVPTFNISDGALSIKHANDKAAVPEVMKRLPRRLGTLYDLYERQELPEARLVRHIDKQLPYSVDINGVGVQVMAEDYDVHTAAQMLDNNTKLTARYRSMFPEPSHELLLDTHDYLADKFALRFPEV